MPHALKFLSVFALLAALGAAGARAQSEPEPGNVLVMELESGRVLIEMLPEVAPRHVARIKELARPTTTAWWWGDPTGTGRGGSGQTLEAEFSNEPFLRGTLGMARARSPDSADSQFFITFAPAPHLDGQYTVWGRVIEGMEHVDRIKKAPPGRRSGMVEDPDRIIRLRVQADIAQ